MLAFNRHISLPTWEDFINGFSFSSGKMAIIHHSVHFWSVLREYGGLPLLWILDWCSKLINLCVYFNRVLQCLYLLCAFESPSITLLSYLKIACASALDDRGRREEAEARMK